MAIDPNVLDALGEVLITGFNGLELSDDTSRFLSQARIGGVILYQQNYQSPGQVAELIQQVQDCRSKLPLWITVDHEGGKIQRFKKPFTRIPDATTITAAGSPKLAFDIGEVMAKELRAVGVNVNLAPVLDIDTSERNPMIGTRAFGKDAETVTKIASGIIRGHIVHGIDPCVKHFPGHGDTATDSHSALPKVNTPLEVLRDREFKPFSRAFRSHCQLVMTAHLLNTAVDPKFPATLSPKFLRDILRGELRYTGLVMSDDMEMKAITENFPADQAPVLALQAGCDLLLYKTEAGCRAAYEAMRKALDQGQLAPEIVTTAAERSRAYKAKRLLPFEPVVIMELANKVGTPEHLAILAKLEAGSAPVA